MSTAKGQHYLHCPILCYYYQRFRSGGWPSTISQFEYNSTAHRTFDPL